MRHTSIFHDGDPVNDRSRLRIDIEECERFLGLTHILQEPDVIEQNF